MRDRAEQHPEVAFGQHKTTARCGSRESSRHLETSQTLLHKNHTITHDDADSARLVDTFSRFFIDKVAGIRDNIAAALQACTDRSFETRHHVGECFSAFSMVSVDVVTRLLSVMPSKSSPLDVLPSSLLKSCSDVFAPVIARLANLSFSEGRFPTRYKVAQVLPLLKKPGLDKSAPMKYRPISNLCTVSKILERLALSQLRPHLLESANFSPF